MAVAINGGGATFLACKPDREMCGVTEPEAEGYLLHRDASCAQKQSGLFDSPELMVSLWRDLVGLEKQAVNLRDSQPGDPLQIFRWIGFVGCAFVQAQHGAGKVRERASSRSPVVKTTGKQGCSSE